jgi:hypothetical protein
MEFPDSARIDEARPGMIVEAAPAVFVPEALGSQHLHYGGARRRPLPTGPACGPRLAADVWESHLEGLMELAWDFRYLFDMFQSLFLSTRC